MKERMRGRVKGGNATWVSIKNSGQQGERNSFISLHRHPRGGREGRRERNRREGREDGRGWKGDKMTVNRVGMRDRE